jgi:hypothetical protein
MGKCTSKVYLPKFLMPRKALKTDMINTKFDERFFGKENW